MRLKNLGAVAKTERNYLTDSGPPPTSVWALP